MNKIPTVTISMARYDYMEAKITELESLLKLAEAYIGVDEKAEYIKRKDSGDI